MIFHELTAAVLNSGDVDIPIVSADGSNIETAINIVTGISAAVAVIIIIISGIRLVTSGGNPEALGNARKTIIYALAGLVVIVAARLIVGIVVGRL